MSSVIFLSITVFGSSIAYCVLKDILGYEPENTSNSKPDTKDTTKNNYSKDENVTKTAKEVRYTTLEEQQRMIDYYPELREYPYFTNCAAQNEKYIIDIARKTGKTFERRY